jgi:nitrogen regulatory protein PII
MSSGRGRDRDSKNRNTENKDDKGATLVDVVYLKNGGILVGNIIEQIPNESLKIQTKDGSVFVYSMSDIARIAKEKR